MFSHSFPIVFPKNSEFPSFPWFSHSFPPKNGAQLVSFPWDAGRGASPGLSEGRAEGVGQLLGESETAGHEGVDHDHVPWFRYIGSDIVQRCDIFRYCSDIDQIL